ncbi:MAG: hypothetical protein VX733_09500 [Candidatus Latescibacterota bacterium]|nr:hypothetical protein [Candidatus Latescibacterota bacterium]
MLYLANDELRLHVLDPVADQSRLGTRYTSGCYVYQIEEARHGPLMSGPVYPSDPPPVFDGQGIPEAFPYTLDPIDGKRLAIGIGIIHDDESDENEFNTRKVAERCTWEIEAAESSLQMRTSQSMADHALQLQRRLTLQGRELTSTSQLRNTGDAPLPTIWFAHPFFHWAPASPWVCRFRGFTATMNDNPGFRVGADNAVERISDHDWEAGQFVHIEGCTGYLLDAEQSHPSLGKIAVTGDFALARMPIWGNACTVSFEPYLEQTLQPGEELSWSLTYRS